MNDVLRRGAERGEIRVDVDVDLISELLVGPLLARMASGATDQLDPAQASRQITDLILTGAGTPCPAGDR